MTFTLPLHIYLGTHRWETNIWHAFGRIILWCIRHRAATAPGSQILLIRSLNFEDCWAYKCASCTLVQVTQSLDAILHLARVYRFGKDQRDVRPVICSCWCIIEQWAKGRTWNRWSIFQPPNEHSKSLLGVLESHSSFPTAFRCHYICG